MAKGLTTQTPGKALVEELLRHCEAQKSLENPQCSLPLSNQDVIVHSSVAEPQYTVFSRASTVRRTASSLMRISHAEPLAALRSQDAAALDEFFADERIEEITLDVYRYLARLYPEPCWEDEPYNFFHDYL